MAHVVMYTSAYCPYCANAERLLASKGVKDIEKPADVPYRRFILMTNISAVSMTCALWIWLAALTPCWGDSALCLQAQVKSAKMQSGI